MSNDATDLFRANAAAWGMGFGSAVSCSLCAAR